MATSWSTLHTGKIVQPPPPSSSSTSSSQPKASGSRGNKTRPKLPMSASLFPEKRPQAQAQALALGMTDPMDIDDLATSSRSSSLAGRKRPRESSDGNGNGNGAAAAASARVNRRTKSVGDTRPGHGQRPGSRDRDRDREAFQRGLIAVFVPKALRDSASKGDMTNYNDLLAHFLPTATSPDAPALPPILPLLRAISAHVSLLHPETHSALVSAIIDLPWAHGDERFVKTFVGWAGVLVSAHPGWTKEVVQMACRGLAWQHPVKPRPELPPATSRRTYHARHHLLLSHLLSLVPTLPNLLGPILVRKFPNKRESEVVQTTWVRNMCELIAYCPELGARIWGEVVDRMLRIDVEINNSLEEEDDDDDDDDEDEDEEDEGQDVDAPLLSASGTLDPFDLATTQDMPKPTADLDSDNDDSDDEDDVDPGDVSSADGERSDLDAEEQDETKLLHQAEKKRQAVKSMRAKLDGMLFYFFRHLEEYMSSSAGERGQSAAEMAAERLTKAHTHTSSGASTPTSEYAPATPGVTATSTRVPTPAQSLAHFQTLLNLFTRQILPTSSTQHIPFLLFLCASFSPAHTDLFLGLLVSQALYASTTASPTAASQPVPLSQRIAATVYIGSIVCRARFVNDDSARQVLTYLLAYLDGKLRQHHQQQQQQLRRRQSGTGVGVGMEDLPLFYAVCQAVMLIFCFRWRAFTSSTGAGEEVLGEMEMEGTPGGNAGAEGDRWMSDLDILQRAITSDLNPLLGCNTTVVSTFAKVAHHTNFAYCFSIIEANQQSTARSSSSHSLSATAGVPASLPRQNSTASASTSSVSIGTGSSTYTVPRKARQANIDAGLDAYYPFDPFTLPRSKRYIDRIYRTWGEVSIPLDDDDDESSSEEEDEEEEGSGSDTDGDAGQGGQPIKQSLPRHHQKPASSSWKRLMPGHQRDDGLSSSLEGMSISPAGAGAGMGSAYMRRP